MSKNYDKVPSPTIAKKLPFSLTRQELASLLRLSPQSLIRLEKQGVIPKARQIPGMRRRFYLREDMEAILGKAVPTDTDSSTVETATEE